MTTTDTVEFPTPGPAPGSPTAISLGMSCSMIAVLNLIYCFDYVFLWLPRVEDLMLSVKMNIPRVAQVMAVYGRYLWALVALAAILSIIEAYRRPGERRTVRIQVAAFASGMILFLLTQHAAHSPFISMLKGIGAP